MNLYKVEMMSHGNYHAYMCGSNNFCVDHAIVAADSKEEAIERANTLYPDMVINEHYVECAEQNVPNTRRIEVIRNYIECKYEKIREQETIIAKANREIEAIRKRIEKAATMAYGG